MSAPNYQLGERATRALQVAFEVFREQGDWPSYQYVDHRLDREGHDAAQALGELPGSLAYFDRMSPRLASITLTVLGVAAAGGSGYEQTLFMRLLRWCVVREQAFTLESATGPPEELRVTSLEFEQESQGSPLTEIDQRKVLSFLRTEALTMGLGGPSAPPEVWTASLDQHRVRRYRQAKAIDAYVSMRAAELSSGLAAALTAPVLARPLAVPAWPQSTGLPRGRRVRAIKDVAHQLADMGEIDRDLTLGGFGIHGTPEFSEDSYAYCTRLLADTDDDTLIELAADLSEQEATGATTGEDEEGPWEPSHFRLFLSHTHAFAGALVEFKADLEALGVDTFIAHVDIDPAEQWETVIETALRTCDALAAYLTEDFAESAWTDQEVGWVAGRRRLVVAIDSGRTPYGFIGKWQSIKASRPDLVDALFGVLASHERSARRMAEIQVVRFERTSSPEKGQQRLELLERIGLSGWNEELLERVERAIVDNRVLASAAIGSKALADIASELVETRRAERH